MTNTNIDYKLKAGDVGLVSSTGFLPKAIKFFMSFYMNKLKLEKRKVYNHVFTVVEIWGETFVAESLVDGYNIRPVTAYLVDGQLRGDVKIRTPKKDYTKEERDLISKYATMFTFHPTRYDYFALLHQLWYAVTLKWKGKEGKEAMGRLYCSESHATLANMVRPATFKNAATTNPLDIDINKYYVDIETKKNRAVK